MNFISIFLILLFAFIFYLGYLSIVVFRKKFGFRNFIMTNLYILLYSSSVIVYYLLYNTFTGEYLEAAQLVFSVLISKGIYIDFIRQIDRQSTKYLRFIVVNIIAYSLIFTQFITLFSKIPTDYLDVFITNDIIYSASYIFKIYIVFLFIFEFAYLFRNLSTKYHRDIINNIFIASLFLLLVIVEIVTVKQDFIIVVRVINYTILGSYILYSRNLFYEIPLKRDIIKNKIGKVSFEKKKNLDALNDVMNREYFMSHINTFEHNEETAVLVIEILGLKYINDILGYEYGDEMIKEFIVVISDIFNCNGIARLSGTQFAVILDKTTEEEIALKMKSTRSLFMARKEFRVFLVYGYSLCPSNSDLESAFKFASENLCNKKYTEVKNNQGRLVHMLHNNFKKQFYKTGAYMKEVSEITDDFCNHLGLDEELIHKIKYAALLSDITVERHMSYVRFSPAFNNEFEKKKYYNHTIKAYEICVETGIDGEVCQMILHSHENYDGSGFPCGLQEEDIAFGAQVIAVVNFVTLFCDNELDIRDELENLRNVKFSDYIVDNMIDFLNSKE